MPDGSKYVDNIWDRAGKKRFHLGSVRAMLRTPARVFPRVVFDVIARGNELLIKLCVRVNIKRAPAYCLVEQFLIGQNILVLNQFYDILVDVVKDTLGVAKNHPHILNVSLDCSESEVFLHLGAHLLSGGQSGDLPVRQ
jgi:hypothetical protein